MPLTSRPTATMAWRRRSLVTEPGSRRPGSTSAWVTVEGSEQVCDADAPSVAL